MQSLVTHMYSARNKKSAISKLLHSTGFLPLVFVVVSILLWTMFIKNYYNKPSLADMYYQPEHASSSTLSNEIYFEQQSINTNPKLNTQDIQALAMQLMQKYQNLALAKDKKYIMSLDDQSSEIVINNNFSSKQRQSNRMVLESPLFKQDTLQNRVNKLMYESYDQDTADTDYMNNLNIDPVTSVIKENDRQL